MARTPRASRKISTRQLKSTPFPVPCGHSGAKKCVKNSANMSLANEQREWKNATCAVCLEPPHNAVLLLCSSHHKGCRPYMCGTNSRHSNCLQQYKKAYAKGSSACKLVWPASKETKPMDLACPLCRGEVKGWTVVEPARAHLNRKKRICMHDGCSFTGTFRALRKHVRLNHRSSKARELDPARVEKWKKLEQDRDRQDVWSTIYSTMPGAVVIGDYVIDHNPSDSEVYSDDDFDGGSRRHGRSRFSTELYNALSRASRAGRFSFGPGAFMQLPARGARATPGHLSRNSASFGRDGDFDITISHPSTLPSAAEEDDVWEQVDDDSDEEDDGCDEEDNGCDEEEDVAVAVAEAEEAPSVVREPPEPRRQHRRHRRGRRDSIRH